MTYIKNASLLPPYEENTIKYTGIDIRGVQELKDVSVTEVIYITDMVLFEESKNCLEEPNPELASLLPVTGKFRYICNRTKPDVLVATGEIATGSQPSNEHYKVAKRI